MSANRDSGVVQMRAQLALKMLPMFELPENRRRQYLLMLYRLTAPTACYAAEYETGLAVSFSDGSVSHSEGRLTFAMNRRFF